MIKETMLGQLSPYCCPHYHLYFRRDTEIGAKEEKNLKPNHLLNGTVLLKNKCAASPQRMPYARREAPDPLGRTVPCLGQGQLQVSQEGEWQWGPGTIPST